MPQFHFIVNSWQKFNGWFGIKNVFKKISVSSTRKKISFILLDTPHKVVVHKTFSVFVKKTSIFYVFPSHSLLHSLFPRTQETLYSLYLCTETNFFYAQNTESVAAAIEFFFCSLRRKRFSSFWRAKKSFLFHALCNGSHFLTHPLTRSFILEVSFMCRSSTRENNKKEQKP